MLASIWLQPAGPQRAMLLELIAALAVRHGTMPFEPHLTVCGAPDLDPSQWDTAAAYVRRSGLLPLTVKKIRISHSTAVWSRAVVIDVENSPDVRAFREELSRIAGAEIQAPPHISLLYTVDENGQRPGWAASETRLRAIAEECAAAVEAVEFALDDPVVIAPNGDWANITSWEAVRRL